MDPNKTIDIKADDLPTIREIKTDFGLTTQQVADILGISCHTVSSWLLDPASPSYRNMPKPMMELLAIKLTTRPS